MTDVKIKLNLVRQHTGLSIHEIATRMGISVQMAYKHLDDTKTPSIKIAMRLESCTGLSHQFFIYPLPTAYKFLPKADQNG